MSPDLVLRWSVRGLYLDGDYGARRASQHGQVRRLVFYTHLEPPATAADSETCPLKNLVYAIFLLIIFLIRGTRSASILEKEYLTEPVTPQHVKL